MLGRIAPVGSYIALNKKPDIDWKNLYPEYEAKLLCSGTAALAAAMVLAKDSLASEERTEVILPAYGCPDLVSAAVYAGLQPVLVDLEPNSPNMALDILEKAITRKTVAIVAVNFLGVAERLSKIKVIADRVECVLIEDNAQCFPEPGQELVGDMVITSFGRGKPVSVLGGGLLLYKKVNAAKKIPISASQSNDIVQLLKLTAYNFLIHPIGYAIVEKLLSGSIGKTAYKKLEGIQKISSVSESRLAVNIEHYLARSTHIQDEIRDLLGGFEQKVIDLTNVESQSLTKTSRYLRYPVLIRDELKRNRIFDVLDKAGMGASKFYGRPLADIEGVKEKVKLFAGMKEAKIFSERLITLPTHGFVNHYCLEQIKQALNRC